ncbi:MAG TPA: c-type cytochrome [Sphingomonas sp.]
MFAASIVAAIVAGGVLYAESQTRTRTMAEALTGGRIAAGREAIAAYGCGSCHVIAGVYGADGMVGPPLDGIATRAQIAGRLPNEPRAMIDWLRHPQAVIPGNGMPEQRITDRGARDITAYLYTLK